MEAPDGPRKLIWQRPSDPGVLREGPCHRRTPPLIGGSHTASAGLYEGASARIYTCRRRIHPGCRPRRVGTAGKRLPQLGRSRALPMQRAVL